MGTSLIASVFLLRILVVLGIPRPLLEGIPLARRGALVRRRGE